MSQIIIASYNIHKCVGGDGVFNPQRIIEVIKECNPDLIALQEVDKRFGSKQGLLRLDLLYQQTGLKYAKLNTIKPESLGWHGNAIFYKNMEIISIEQIKLPGLEPRGAIFAIFKKNDIKFCVIAAHFGLLRRCRKSQINTILNIFSKKYSMPAFLLGDLNEWRNDRKSALQQLSNHFDIKQPANASFPASMPLLSLDKIFASNEKMILYTKTNNSKLAKIASDHLPILALVDINNINNNEVNLQQTQAQ